MPSPTTPRLTSRRSHRRGRRLRRTSRRRRPRTTARRPGIRPRRSMAPAAIPQRPGVHHQPRRRRTPHDDLVRIGRQVVLALDLRRAADRRVARPDVHVLDDRVGDAGVIVVGALCAVVFHAEVLAEVREVDDFACGCFFARVSLFLSQVLQLG